MTKTVHHAPPDRTATKDPLLVVGCQRSGTTLLRTILNSHADCAIGYECDFWEPLYPIYGGTLDIWTHKERFLDDLFSVPRFAFWKLDRADLDALFAAAPKPIPFARSIRLICEAYRQKHKPRATTYGVKNPNSIERLDLFFELFPNGRVVHIIRDPRAVLASEKKKLTKRDGQFSSQLNTIRVARRWNRAMRGHDAHRSDPRYCGVLYHDLIADTEPTLRTLCKRLAIPFDPDMLRYYETADTPGAEMWQHALTKAPPDPNRLSAHLDDLTERENAAMNYLCRAHLADYSDGQQTGFSRITLLPHLTLGWAHWAIAGLPRKTAHVVRSLTRTKAR